MALDRYQAAGKDLLDKYQVLSQQDKAGYDRYQDAVNHYYGELDRLQNAYDRLHDREYGAFVADRDFHYAREQDEKKAAWQAQQAQREQARFELQQAYQKERDKIRDEQWRQDFEESRRRYGLDLQLRQAAAAAAARRGSGSSRGSGRGSCQKPRPGGGPLGRFSRDEYYGWRKSASHTGSRFTQAPAGGRFSR